MDIKVEALLAVARAYISRGKFLQYDQRCMDRQAFLTPRRTKCLPPESATAQHTLYLDCSSYVGAMFYEAFGYELPFDLTWHMVDYLEPRVFYYERTHNETIDEIAKLKAQIVCILKPGDVITFDRITPSGHTMLYMGDGVYTHSTTKGRPDSYDYENHMSREYESGGVFVDSLDELLDKKLFTLDNIKRIAIERPLDLLHNPTSNSMARIGGAKNLFCSVESSHTGGHHAVLGETITYKVYVRNDGETEKTLIVDFTPANGSTLVGDRRKNFKLSPREETKLSFETVLNTVSYPYLEGPMIIVNGLNVYAPKVLIGKISANADLSALNQKVVANINNQTSATESAALAYEQIGIAMSSSEKQHIFNCFYIHDALCGDILTRRAQMPSKDLAVYSLFGGTGVATPEMISYPHIRCNQIRRRDLLPGDLIICSNNPYATETYSCYYTGDSLVGRFEYNADLKFLENEAIDRFIDSLFGKFCFIVLRPSLG